MASERPYSIRWEDGTRRTVYGWNVRNAAVRFCTTGDPKRGIPAYDVPVGGTFWVLPIDKSEPEACFRRTSVGLRRLSS
jgi:hypothetical protein